jgi:hypothetical protein
MAAPKGNTFAKGNATSGRPKIYDDERIEEEAAALLEWIKVDGEHKIYIGSFAKERGYDRAQLSEFARNNDIFSRAYRMAKQWQEEKFIRNGLTRTWDSAFTARVMARVCSDEWKNSWDTDPTNENIAALATAVMNYATAQPQDKGWQQPQEKPKKK